MKMALMVNFTKQNKTTKNELGTIVLQYLIQLLDLVK